jgi:hypothetical protein
MARRDSDCTATGRNPYRSICQASARSRWNLLVHGSIVDRFLSDVRHATVQIVPR